MLPYLVSALLLSSLYVAADCPKKNSACHYRDFFLLTNNGSNTLQKLKKSIYILYDVNAVEGFNLRRDVYIRMAVFLKTLREKKSFGNTKLVLPPFPRLYHWKSDHIQQDGVLWKSFFDVQSLQNYTAVLDFDEFLTEDGSLNTGKIVLDQVYQLRNFEEMFVNGVFVDKFEEQACRKEDQHRRDFFNNPLIAHKSFSCLKFQGSASLLGKFLKKKLKKNKSWPFKVLLLNAEIVLHDFWGNDEFWRARRSMRFSENLMNIAKEYRLLHFNSTDENEKVQMPLDWRNEKPYRGAIGGGYLCAHIRRGDFVHGRESTTPSLKSIANQITAKLKILKISKVFISSDCSSFEYQNLKSHLARAKVYRFKPESFQQKLEIMDGGVAIVDQIICSHARYFIGTYESTFTYRIYEEREILGFPKDTTFNTFCKNEDLSNCEKNSVWPIVY